MRASGALSTAVVAASLGLLSLAGERSRRIEYSDLPPAVRTRLSTDGLTAKEFDAYLRSVETETDQRVADGEREHLIYYALQSGRFTARPRIEPAMSALRFVERLSQRERAEFLESASYLPSAGWPADERARVADLLRALRREPADPRLAYFKQLVQLGGRPASIDALYADYVRVARFLYRKEFLWGSPSPADVTEVARLYQGRPHSSDTQIESGFGVYLGLGALAGLETRASIRRVLVVGPGLDLAPRTGLIDAAPPQSYQPFAVADALVALALASDQDLRIHAVDVNRRVVDFMQRIGREPVTLHLFTGITETAERPFAPEYRNYARQLGRAIGHEVSGKDALASELTSDPHYLHSVTVRPAVVRAMSAERLNVITERLVLEAPFDLVLATNVLSYFDDRQLALVLSNIAAMVRPGGYVLHNESRVGLVELADRAGLPLLHMRTLVLGGSSDRPLHDAVWVHRRGRGF